MTRSQAEAQACMRNMKRSQAQRNNGVSFVAELLHSNIWHVQQFIGSTRC